jgi:hypothetical protein
MNSNPLRILQTLDGCLHAPFTLHVGIKTDVPILRLLVLFVAIFTFV